MLTVRLHRVGRRNDPSYRVVVVDSKRSPKTGRVVEMVGSHDPKRKKTTIKGERVLYWRSVGASISPTVHNILVTQKIIDEKKINVLPKKSPYVRDDNKGEAEKPEATAVASETEGTPTEEEGVKESSEKDEDNTTEAPSAEGEKGEVKKDSQKE